MTDTAFVGKTAIAGIGATEFSKESGRSPLQLACEATLAALDDAGLAPADVDGMVTFTADTNPETEIARNIGIPELTFFSRIDHGGGAACGVVQQAALAVASGVAEVVVCYRAFNERSEHRFGTGVQGRQAAPTAVETAFSWFAPHGLLTPAQWVAMHARRYMHEYGATSAHFGMVAVADRKHAANNPAAWFHDQPITLEDHQTSRMIADPLAPARLLPGERRRPGAGRSRRWSGRGRSKQPPAVINGAAQGIGPDQHMMTSYYRPSITGLPAMGVCARQLYEQSGISPSDIQTAVLYDHFTPVRAHPAGGVRVLRARARPRTSWPTATSRSAAGRCPPTPTAASWARPTSTGVNGIAEGVRQVRGTSVNQVDDVENVLVTAGTGVPTSALLLRPDG